MLARGRTLLAIPCVLGLGMLAGCSTAVPERDQGFAFGDTPGDAWAGVFPATDAPTDPDILARRDDVAVASNLPADFWPGDPKPSLAHPIRVTLDRTPERVLFFRPGLDRRQERGGR